MLIKDKFDRKKIENKVKIGFFNLVSIIFTIFKNSENELIFKSIKFY